MTEQLSGEEMLDQVAQHLANGELPPEVEEAEIEPTDTDQQETQVGAEEKARADGWVPYEEWKQSGRDPRQWRPAEEYNERGDLLRTPKVDLVKQVQEAARKADEAARLMAQQMAMAKEREDRARKEAAEEAVAKYQREMEEAWAVGDKAGYDKAAGKVAEAEAAKSGQPEDPRLAPEVREWSAANTWYADGFDEIGAPKTREVKDFLDFQRTYAQARPSEPLINSIRYAERKVKEMSPDAFKPKATTARAPLASAGMASGARAQPQNGDDGGFSRLSSDEQGLVKKMCQVTGMSLKDYMKEYNRGIKK